MNHRQTDVAIIGAGTAGMTAYRAVKKAGLSAILIEGGPYGTMCARVGCMPSKLLVAAADVAHVARNTAGFGVHVDNVHIDGKQVMERVRRERDRFVGFVLDSIEAMPEADKVQGYAHFLSDTTLQVDDHTQISAGRIIIATGSTPTIPEMYRSLGDRLVVNDEVFSWNDLPKKLAVIGTGVIALELGQALSRLGVKVRVLGRGTGLAGISDPEVRKSAQDAFEKDFDLHLEASVVDVSKTSDGVRLRYVPQGKSEVEECFDYVLAATGRHPEVSGLKLENTTAVLDNGQPVFDADTLQLGSTSIFIAGDVDGRKPLLHEAADDGYIAGNNAVQFPEVSPGKRRAPLTIVFTDPQIISVGIRYKDLPATAVMGDVTFSNQGRSRILLKNYGMLRVYAERKSGVFLGAEMAGPAAEHIGHLLAWAVQQGLTVAQMLAMPFYHPVIEEGLRTALRDVSRKID